MLDEFTRFVNEQQLVRQDDRVLLAVSGGVDSVVMCELFYRAGFTFSVAHCNFGLRGSESDMDEEFVRELATHYGVPFFVKRFDTSTIAREENISIQVAARRLRYQWFEELRANKGYASIATAHHRNDEVETFFINLVRGTGIAGLRGIPVRNGNVIRPLLFALREDIEAFAAENGLKWREDSSNRLTKYLRNKIRQNIIPALKEINPHIEDVLSADMRRIREAFQVMASQVEEKRKEIMSVKEDHVVISISKLEKLQPLHTYLYEFLRPYDFSEAVVHEIAAALKAEPGKQFYSPNYRLVKDRSELIITPIPKEELNSYLVWDDREYDQPFLLKLTTVPAGQMITFKAPPFVAYLDKAKLKFPLTLRKWQQGDHFVPLGMKHKKKLSDLLIDRKLSLVQKENVWVLLSANDIVWVVGIRPDDRFRVTPGTKEVLKCELPNSTNYGTFEA